MKSQVEKKTGNYEERNMKTRAWTRTRGRKLGLLLFIIISPFWSCPFSRASTLDENDLSVSYYNLNLNLLRMYITMTYAHINYPE